MELCDGFEESGLQKKIGGSRISQVLICAWAWHSHRGGEADVFFFY